MIDQEAQCAILESVDRFCRGKVDGRAAEIDRDDIFPDDLYKEAAAMGLFGLWIPPEFGGVGPDLITPLLVSERIARSSASFSLIFSNCGDATTPLVNAGSAELKKQYLPAIANGDVIPCFGLSEPGAGSDAASIKTTASRDGDHYVINGRKMWCTNASVGNVFTIFAKTDPEAGAKGVSAIVVPLGAEGFTVGPDEPLIGLRGCPANELILEDVRVPVSNRLGEEGAGFKIAMVALDEARLNCSAMALGAATSALEHAVEYAKDRVAFGKPVIDHQGLNFLLADCAASLAAARALWDASTAKLEAGRTPEASIQAAMAKLVCTETAMKVTTECVQALGGNGLSRNYPVERAMRDCKPFEIFDGTSQIQKLVIGRYLKKSGVPF